ncbi:hypothetical protein OQA88_7339 [Cercophora sp. LCS_1]
MGFEPDELAGSAAVVVTQQGEADGSTSWCPLFRHGCTFPPAVFDGVLLNLIRNPNINSSWLFRADILHDVEGNQLDAVAPELPEHIPYLPSFDGFKLRRHIVRRLIPRSTQRDKPMDQTCLIYEGSDRAEKTLVVYIPHAPDAEMPFYHPKVRGIAFLHEWTAAEERGSISISYQFFEESDRSVVKLARTALQLLKVIYKHGQGRVAGYQKRVHHDVLVPQTRLQNTYTVLKQKYARDLIKEWAESTDPVKHVFEDLCIAAFLIELWADMYQGVPFPGFVDIGCGNGLLVFILNREGFDGWGFDARSRKSWTAYSTKRKPCLANSDLVDSLQQLVLLPPPVNTERLPEIAGEDFAKELVHDGRFPRGTFIISNHADELTPWTPILASVSDCPFIMIPCCSHDLTGSKFRAPAPKDKSKGGSSYASLVEWAADIARDCGWDVEQEMLRIPSTRNTALVGRKRLSSENAPPFDLDAIVQKYGGTAGYLENVVKLATRTAASTGPEPEIDFH